MTDQHSISADQIVEDTAPAPASEAGAPGAATVFRVFRRMPPEIRDSFSPVQRQALGKALAREEPARFPVNLRFTLLGVFFAFIIGRENRSAARRRQERIKHPLLTPGNLIVMLLACPFGVMLGWAVYVLLIHGEL
jgi:hypothetical protein